MPENANDICIRLKVLNPHRLPLGGRVDLEFKPREGGETLTKKAVDASKDIDVRGLQRFPKGLYTVTVTPTDGGKPTSQFVTIPASDFATVEFIIDKEGSTQDFVVRGTVRDANGRPLPGIFVRALDRDLRPRHSQQLGGPAVTNDRGFYEIRYAAKDFARAEAGGPDIQVQAFESRALDRLLGESAVLFNAGNEATIDLTLEAQSKGPSEFEMYLAKLLPLLKGQADDGSDLRIADLTVPDVEFSAADTGIDRQRIAWLQIAAAFEMKVASGRAPAAFFYGLFRKGVPDSWEQLIEQPIGELRKAAHAAIEHEIIPDELESRIEEILAILPNPRRDELHTVVGVAGLDASAVDKILSDTSSLTEVTNDRVARWVEQGSVSISDAHRLGLSITAHELAGGKPSVAAAVAKAKPARWDGRELQRARDLAALDTPDIEQALVSAQITPPDGMTLSGYAARLASQIAETFPGDAMVHRATHVTSDVVSAIEEAGAEGANAANDPRVRAFMNLHPGLELETVFEESAEAPAIIGNLKERVGFVERAHALNPDLDLLAIDYMPDSADLDKVKFDGLSEEARSLVIANFKSYQRMQGAGAGTLAGLELMKAGYRSATALARSSPEEIAERSGLSVTEARRYYALAKQKADETALTDTVSFYP